MGEFVTAVKYKLPIIVVVIKNNVLGQIKWEQIVFLGNPKFAVELQPIDFAKYAQVCGGIGISVKSTDEIEPALKQSMASVDKPVLVEVYVDPNEPPMPPKVTAEQAMHLAEALARGQADRGRIALTLFRDKINELI